MLPPRVSVKRARRDDETRAELDETSLGDRAQDGQRPGLATLLMMLILAISASGASLVFGAGLSGFLMVFGLMALAAVMLDLVFGVDVFH